MFAKLYTFLKSPAESVSPDSTALFGRQDQSVDYNTLASKNLDHFGTSSAPLESGQHQSAKAGGQTRGPRNNSKISNEFRQYCNGSSSNKRLNP